MPFHIKAQKKPRIRNFGNGVLYSALSNEVALYKIVLRFYLNNDRSACGAAFAWASMAVPAWSRIWFLVNAVISLAISVSRMVDSADCTFSMVVARLAEAYPSLFWAAPISPRRLARVLMAAVNRIQKSLCIRSRKQLILAQVESGSGSSLNISQQDSDAIVASILSPDLEVRRRSGACNNITMHMKCQNLHSRLRSVQAQQN